MKGIGSNKKTPRQPSYNCRKGDLANLFKRTEYLWSKIYFTRIISKKILYQLYSIADVGVVPSTYDGFGFVVVEMMMHKLLVVVNNSIGVSEIVNDGVTDFYTTL